MLFWLLAAPVAIIVRACTTEEVFRQPREFCATRHRQYGESLRGPGGANFTQRVSLFVLEKLCYIPTCDYCLSFWVSLIVVWLAEFSLHFDDWRGFALATFVVMGVANVYLAIFSHLRVDLRKQRATADKIEESRQ